MEKTRRKSRKREKILNALKKAKCALSAADIHKKVPDIDLVTVYRNLDLFVDEGMIKKLSLDKLEALYEYQEHNHHHAICTDCGKIIHFRVFDKKIMDLIKLETFKPESIELTVRGKCGCK